MSEELQIVPIEEQISQELVKHNVTQAVISTLNEKYGQLEIAGIEDKETYLLVKEGRKECKAFRVAAKKICEKGREEAVAIQKAWVAKQKEVTDQIAAIEDPLEEQEKAYEAAVAKEKEDRRRRQEEQLINRQQVLTNMGALYSDGSFKLGEISFELSVVKESESDIWEESILPKFKEEYEKVEAERIEQERIKKEQEEELKRKKEEIDRQTRELQDREAALKKAEEERLAKEKEDQERKRKEAVAAQEAKDKARIDQLYALGLNYDVSDKYFKGYDCYVHTLDIQGYSDEKWSEMINKITPYIAEQKAEAEQKRLAEIEAQKEAARKKAIGASRSDSLKAFNYIHTGINALADYSEEEWLQLHESVKKQYDEDQKLKWEKEQEEKRKQEELIRLQKLDAAKDKEKWEEMMQKINEVVVYEMRSSQYRKKAMILREKLEEIKAL
jgi:colicin import membrane protein